MEKNYMSLALNAFLTLLVLSLAVSTILFLLLRSSLSDLLRHTLKLQAGVTFYLRSFLLVLFLSALSAAIGTSFDLKPDARFMEYVWKAAEGMSSTLEKTLWFIAIYLVLVTILVATLKVKDDK
jgi:preprotein translocase subunit SecG